MAFNRTLPSHVSDAHMDALSDDRKTWASPPHLTFLPERLDEPSRVRKPGRVFVCSISDLGHEAVRFEWRHAIYGAMLDAPQHTYIVLTKRPGRWIADLPRGTWAGVTVEDQSQQWRVDELADWHVGTRFVSVEPMLGPVTLRGLGRPIDWVIAGPETGPKARPCEDAWIDALAAESKRFFDKRKGGKRREFPVTARAIGGPGVPQ